MIRPLRTYAQVIQTVRTAARQVLAELELTSVMPARAFVSVITTNPPQSRPPSGEPSPADQWRAHFDRAAGEDELAGLVRQARAELRALRRRSLPIGPWDTEVDLAERILSGEGLAPEEVALQLRCTPRKVRQLRLAAGRDAQRGRRLAAPDATALLHAGLSYRAVSAITGVPRSTLYDHAHHKR